MSNWPPYFVDGRWDVTAVRNRQEGLAIAQLPWTPRSIDLLSDPLPESFVEHFETSFGIVLPVEYRSFLLLVGDGGFGPGLGMRHLGRPLDDSAKWTPGAIETNPDRSPDPLLGQPFDHAVPVAAMGPGPEIGGLLHLFDFGDAMWDVLVVTGPSRGEIWSDLRTDQIGIVPVEFDPVTSSPKHRHPGAAAIGDRLSFADYYGYWLTTGSAR